MRTKPKTTFVKIGTMPGECVNVRLLTEERVGGRVEFQREKNGKWQEAVIDKIENRRLFLFLM